MVWQRRSIIVTVGLATVGCYAILVAHRHGMSLTRWPMKPVVGSPNPAYIVTDLGSGEPMGMNNNGGVVGSTEFRPSHSPGYPRIVFHGFIWESSKRSEVGTFGGPISEAYRINDQGQVLGEADTAELEKLSAPTGRNFSHPFLWQNGRMTDISRIAGYKDVEVPAFAPDGRMLICAIPTDSSKVRHAYLYDGTKMQDLGALGAQISNVVGINAKNEIIGLTIAGYVTYRNGKRIAINHACLWQNGRVRDLGTLGGSESIPMSINNQGQVVGHSDFTGGLYHAFLWDRGKMQDLGTLVPTSSYMAQAYNSSAEWINNKGQVVGYSASPDNGNYEGFIWEKGKMTELGNMIPQTHWYGLDGGWYSIGSAVAINDKGQIIGEGGKIGDEVTHTYLLTPIKN